MARLFGKPVNANLGLKVNQIITFSPIEMIFAVLFCVYGDHRRPNNIQKTSPQSYKTQINILSSTGQTGATLSGWLKSIY